MRIEIFIAFVAIATVNAVSNCTVKPSDALWKTWCDDCYQKTYSELVCSTCNGLHLNVDKNGCVDWDCSVAQPNKSDMWCSGCEITNKFASEDGKSCISKEAVCAIAPSASTKTDWCSTCFNKVFNGLVCTTCSSKYINADKTACVDQDCSKPVTTYEDMWCNACELTKKVAASDGKSCVLPATDCSKTQTTYTTSWCTKCETVKQTASADGKSCVNIDCSVKPTKNYTDDWCNACSNPPTKALADKSACIKSSTTTTSTNGRILSLAISMLLILFATL